MTDPRVDAYIDRLPHWQQVRCREVRALIHAAAPDIEETIKRTDRPYFVLQGNVCAWQATKDHLNVFIYDPVAPDPDHLINQGEGNATARAIQLYQHSTLDAWAFQALIAAVVANNRAGGWRRLAH